MFFRKSILRARLKKSAEYLIKGYGFRPFYSKGQIGTIIKKQKIKTDKEFIYQLFQNLDDYSFSEIERVKRERKSLYKYFERSISDAEIENNDYYKILNLNKESKIPGDHTPIGINHNVMVG